MFRGQKIIFAGDFNCVLTENDIIGVMVGTQVKGAGRGDLNQMDILSNIEMHTLTEAFQHKHPNSTEMTLENKA